MIYRPQSTFSFKNGRIPNRLEKSSNPRKPGRPLKNGLQVIHTLDPNKFAEKNQQPLYLGGIQSFKPQISLLKQSSLDTVSRLFYDQIHKTQARPSFPYYPSKTKAFLYYAMLPEKPRIAGELRFRVTSRNRASFEKGSDLLRTNGQLWSRPIYALSKFHVALYEKLREDGLIPDDLDKALSALPSQRYNYCRSHVLYTLNDPFILDFSSYRSAFLVITEQGVAKLPLHKLFVDTRGTCRAAPYTGRALVRFERSTLPEHKDTRTVLLRFLKITTPVNCVIPDYDDYVCFPKEGGLHRRSPRHKPEYGGKKDPQVWSADIDKPNYSTHLLQHGLQLLWDA